MKQAILWGATAFLIACAPVVPKGPLAPDAPSLSFRATANVDAVLPSGRNLFVFDFSRSRYQKWNLSQGPADSLGLCRVLDTLQGNWSAPTQWLTLPSPSLPFSPLRAIWGPSGDFFLLDRAGKRLSLHDSGGQLLSSFELPREIRERNLDRFDVFWTRDGVFSFVDLAEGTVWQYAELRALGGQGDWRLRNTIRLPLGLETCLWEPFFRDPCCLHGEDMESKGRDGKGICFDKYFNPRGPWPPDAGKPGLRPVAVSGFREWMLILDGGPICGSRPSACFFPEKGLLTTCPAEPDAALPR
ncbi:MAG: hypothetical protein M3Y08_20575 [Fibrobacterota bacterium]|nr:hypothetical protein [Fibrobacterota bacterium]